MNNWFVVRHLAVARIALAAFATSACAELGVVGDGTTVSWGPPNEGVLVNGARLPRQGEGFVVPPRWAARGTQYGTDELIDTIAHVGRAVAATHPGSRVVVGDLSIPGGGKSAHHRSHQTGRDVDLVLFAKDASGKPIESIEMRHFGPDGKTVDAGPPLTFDAERSWTVVRALVEAPGPGVANIFLYAPLRDLVLDHARAAGVPDSIVDLAGQALAQPSDSAPHDDHMHIRIYCSESDATCSDYAWRMPPKKPRTTAVEEDIAGELSERPRIGSMLHFGPRW